MKSEKEIAGESGTSGKTAEENSSISLSNTAVAAGTSHAETRMVTSEDKLNGFVRSVKD